MAVKLKRKLQQKILPTAAQIMLMIILFSLPVWGANELKVTVDGQEMLFDARPQLVGSRILLPLRSIFEVLNARVAWVDGERKVIATRDASEIIAKIDAPDASVNGNAVMLDVPPLILEGRTYVPARFVAESLGASVRWDETNRSMIISGNLPERITRYNVMHNNLLLTLDQQKCLDSLLLSTDKAYMPETYAALEKGLVEKYPPVKTGFDTYYGSQNGLAVYCFANGDKYIGDLADGKKNGKGLYTWGDGGFYVGGWLNDNRHGQGISSDGKGRYYGWWAEDRKNGHGIVLHQNGDRLMGVWENDEITGVSIYSWADGDKYIGEVDQNFKITNRGVYYFANGEIRVGDIVNNHFRQCKVILTDGLSFVGEIDEEGNRIKGEYYITKEGRVIDIHQKCAEIINAVCTKEMGQKEKERALHDYLIRNVRFDEENNRQDTIPEAAYTAYGAFYNGVAVCEGYAEAMNYLLSAAGIEAQMITGKAGPENDKANWKPHAWNLVKLDGKTYHLDVTWDDPDQGSLVETDYFNVGAAFISKTHSWDTNKYPVN